MSGTALLFYVRSNMGLVHAVSNRRTICGNRRTICGTTLRESWEQVHIPSWASEPNVCRSCDDVLMGRGRKAAS